MASARTVINVKDGIHLNQGRKHAITEKTSTGSLALTIDPSGSVDLKKQGLSFLSPADARQQNSEIKVAIKKLKQQFTHTLFSPNGDFVKVLVNCNRAIERYPSVSKLFAIRGRTFLEMRKKARKLLKDKSVRIREWETGKFAEQALVDFLASINLLEKERALLTKQNPKSSNQQPQMLPGPKASQETITDGQFADLECWIAYTHYKMGNLEDAMFFIHQAQHRVSPPMAASRIQYVKGLVLGVNGYQRISESERCFELAETKAGGSKEIQSVHDLALMNKCYYRHGYAFLLLKRFDEAIDCFQRAIGYQDEDHKSRFRLAMTFFIKEMSTKYSAQGRKKLTALMQDRLRFLLYDAKAESKPGKKLNDHKKTNLTDEEMAYAEILRAIHVAKKPEYLCFRGILQLQYEEYDEACADFQAALNIDPNCAAAQYYKARALFLDGNNQDTEALLHEVNAAIEMDKKNPRPWLLKAQTVIQQFEKVKSGIDVLERQGNIKDPEKLYAEQLANLRSAALQYTNKAVECTQPDPYRDPFVELDLSDEKVSLLALLFKGVLNRRCGNEGQAIEDLTEFLGRHENATAYKATLQVGAYKERGRAYLASGKYLKAEQDFDQAILCMDNAEVSDTAMAYFYRGQVKLKTGQLQKAIEDFEQYKKIYKLWNLEIDPECLAGLAECYHKQREYLQAAIFYSRAAQIKPLVTRYLIGKAEAYYCHQSYGEALDALHRAQGQERDNPNIHYRIG